MKKRNELINLLDEGKIDKNLFINENYKLYENEKSFDLPKYFDNLEHGIYYYQLFNTLAKIENIKYNELKYKEPFEAINHKKKSEFYYKMKEKTTMKILKFAIKYNEEFNSYFIKANSKKLHSNLVEIDFYNKEKVILHTLDEKIINLLIINNRLKNINKKSKIENYINKKYC